MTEAWPLVVEGDDGIRPAGGPDLCFFCGSGIGAPHGRECVAVTKRVALRVSVDGFGEFTVEEDLPWHWDEGLITFARNESSWCADNVLDLLPDGEQRDRLSAFCESLGGDQCLCGRCSISLVRVVDPTPYRAVVSSRDDENDWRA